MIHKIHTITEQDLARFLPNKVWADFEASRRALDALGSVDFSWEGFCRARRTSPDDLALDEVLLGSRETFPCDAAVYRDTFLLRLAMVQRAFRSATSVRGVSGRVISFLTVEPYAYDYKSLVGSYPLDGAYWVVGNVRVLMWTQAGDTHRHLLTEVSIEEKEGDE